MTDTDLDTCYTALCQAMGDVGQDQAPLLLATLSLSLLSRLDGAEAALPLIQQARERCLSEPLHGL
jgi:hypothetical protein